MARKSEVSGKVSALVSSLELLDVGLCMFVNKSTCLCQEQERQVGGPQDNYKTELRFNGLFFANKERSKKHCGLVFILWKKYLKLVKKR